MKIFSVLMDDALERNRERINTLSAFQSIIHQTNQLVLEYEKEPGIDFIAIAYPAYGNDYLGITIYLSKKGKIVKDVGSFIESFIDRTGCHYNGKVSIDAKEQTKTWPLIHQGFCYMYNNDIKNPRIYINADAKKSVTCKSVPTGEMIPVYKFICEDD